MSAVVLPLEVALPLMMMGEPLNLHGREDQEDGEDEEPSSVVSVPVVPVVSAATHVGLSSNDFASPAPSLASSSAQVRAMQKYERKRQERDNKELEMVKQISALCTQDQWRAQHANDTVRWNADDLCRAVREAVQCGGYSGIYVKPPYKLTNVMIEAMRQEPGMIRHQWSVDQHPSLFLGFFDFPPPECIWYSIERYLYVSISGK